MPAGCGTWPAFWLTGKLLKLFQLLSKTEMKDPMPFSSSNLKHLFYILYVNHRRGQLASER